MHYKFLPLQILLISFIAYFSQYGVPDFSDSNWSTVLFLTPFGILDNFMNKNTSVLWTFYSDTSSGQLQISIERILGMSIIYLLMLASVFTFIKKRKA